jgi:hypothetical protein
LRNPLPFAGKQGITEEATVSFLFRGQGIEVSAIENGNQLTEKDSTIYHGFDLLAMRFRFWFAPSRCATFAFTLPAHQGDLL